jgi:hypothetical protein
LFVFVFSSPQIYTYPGRSNPYVQSGVPLNYGNLEDLFTPNRNDADQFVDVYRDNSDDEIFV